MSEIDMLNYLAFTGGMALSNFPLNCTTVIASHNWHFKVINFEITQDCLFQIDFSIEVLGI